MQHLEIKGYFSITQKRTAQTNHATKIDKQQKTQQKTPQSEDMGQLQHSLPMQPMLHVAFVTSLLAAQLFSKAAETISSLQFLESTFQTFTT